MVTHLVRALARVQTIFWSTASSAGRPVCRTTIRTLTYKVEYVTTLTAIVQFTYTGHALSKGIKVFVPLNLYLIFPVLL